MISIPLHGRDHQVRGYAKVDADSSWLLTGPWHIGAGGYAVQTLHAPGDGYDNYDLRMHRLLLGLDKNDPRVVDHINRDRLDNRLRNLRITDVAGNNRNKGAYRQNRRGAYPCGNSWVAAVRRDGQLYRLGRFPSREAALAVAAEFRSTTTPN